MQDEAPIPKALPVDPEADTGRVAANRDDSIPSGQTPVQRPDAQRLAQILPAFPAALAPSYLQPRRPLPPLRSFVITLSLLGAIALCIGAALAILH